MATSIDHHRQFNYLDHVTERLNRRSVSPVRSNHFQPTLDVTKPTTFDDSLSDEDDETELIDYTEAIKKGKMETEPPIHDSRDQGTADNWIQRNPTMIRLTGKHPFNSEPSLPRLMHHGFITPSQLHYVRNHGPVPKITWDDWTVEITGLVSKPTMFTMNQLVNDFTSVEFPVTLVCAGNRRKEQNMVKKTIGFNWGAAGVSNSVWRGVPLRQVLKRCGILSRNKGALNVCFEGEEDLPGGGGAAAGVTKYGTSLKKEVAMDPSRDIILAYMQNGELLSPDHGYPIRMIIPGFIGGRMVKWLKRIIVTTKESDNYYHYRDNRVLPSHVDAELANSEAWWYKPEYIINELNTNSVITTPCHEEVIPINSWTTQKPYTMKGYAYSGGGKKVNRVEVTMDGGETWKICDIERPEIGNKYGRYWCWCFWSLEIELVELLVTKEIAVRAWDESLNTQPEKLIWNLMGMMNNCWFRVKTNICRPQKGEIGITFEHPTLPANQPGGWMERERHLELSSTEPNSALKKSISSPFMNTTAKSFTMSEVNRHASEDSAWIVVHGHVYDCTKFLKDHPGGADSILINAGTDCTEEFDDIHSDKAKKMLEDYRIGELITTGYNSSDSSTSSPNTSVHNGSNQLAPINEVSPLRSLALSNPREKIQCKLVEKTSISHDVRVFKFALQSDDQYLGLPVGKHIFVCSRIEEKLCMRAYTPSSHVDVVGYFELVVKIYFKDANPKFPSGGLMSQHLDSLMIGAVVDFKGPTGHIEYVGKGSFIVHGKPKFARKLSMIAGGTGITPMYQIIQAILKDPEDRTEMHLIYANRTEDDILLWDELEGYAEKHSDQFKVWYVIQDSVREGWKHSVGFISETIVRDHIPGPSEDTLALTCGPPPMIQFAVQPNLEKMGYDVKESLLVF
ncbi:nitrate reductase [NADH]-like [Impatiens glandulifera]|uniref:nitrate reductase [NADH]-like n=1 Tax=Impatiens glandulifera TaxID=253017 RepID=UPI001FB0D86B|nr:nitrate reductase [NADH]-like [Impatiens glandulifera]